MWFQRHEEPKRITDEFEEVQMSASVHIELPPSFDRCKTFNYSYWIKNVYVQLLFRISGFFLKNKISVSKS